MAARPIFSSRLTTILTLIGVAVGLGNVWRFPYMMGKYGGSAFLLIYLLFTFLIAVPALMGEISLGRSTRQGPVGAFRKAFGKRNGSAVGTVLLVTILVASSYYAVVIANVIYATFFSLCVGFSPDVIDRYSKGLAYGTLQYSIAVIVIALCLFVIHRGLIKGIEWVSKIFVPFFLIVILFLIYHSLQLDGAVNHIMEFLKPDFSLIKPIHVFAALGQAVYSLSLGGTFMVIYGSYLSEESSIPHIALWTALGDVGAALLTSIFIVPIVLVFQIDMTSGPTLIFSTLPYLFGQMPAGQLVGTLFLLALSLVAFLSLVAALDVAFSCISEMKWIQLSKSKTLFLIAIIEFGLAYPSAMDSNLIEILDLVFGSGMQVLGCGLALVALTWGLGQVATNLQLHNTAKKRGTQLLFLWMKWLIPFVLLTILIGYIYSSTNG